jgi:hypothetical protein
MSYWDTSCLVKLYAAEPDSSLFESHALASYPLTNVCVMLRFSKVSPPTPGLERLR